MKRRLQRAYDSMTMPEDCSQRIEKAMQRQLRKQKNTPSLPRDAHTRIIAPTPKRTSLWATAAAAVLLVLVISVGGVGLILYGPDLSAADPVSATTPKVTEMIVPTTEPTPEDFYDAATSLSAAEVEATAEEIRQAILQKDWGQLYSYLIGSYQRGDLPLGDLVGFEDFMLLQEIHSDFLKAIEEESCRKMFCNYDDGIMMGDQGKIWLQEFEGKLKIAAINDMLSGNLLYEYGTLDSGGIVIRRYLGSEENVVIPSRIDGQAVTRIGMVEQTGTGAFQNCSSMKTVTIPDSVVLIDDNSFSGCANLEQVYVGAGVTSVGHCAFEVCPMLRSLYFYGDAPAGGNYIFSETDEATIYYNEPANGWTDSWEGRPTAVMKLETEKGGRLFEELFLPLAEGTIGNSEQAIREAVQRLEFEILEENGVWLIQDPEVPGDCINAKPLLRENGWYIDQAGYCRTVDGQRYNVKVTQMLSSTWKYCTGTSIFAEGGTQVDSPGEFRDYLASAPEEARELLDAVTANEKLMEILSGTGTFLGYYGEATIEDYFAQEMSEGIYATVTHYVVADLDGNDYNEALLRLNMGEAGESGTLVLFTDGGHIRGEILWQSQMNAVKEDGTFSWSGGSANHGTGKLKFSGGQPMTQKLHWCEAASTDTGLRFWKDGGTQITQAEYEQILAVQDAKKGIHWNAYPIVEVDGQQSLLNAVSAFEQAFFENDVQGIKAQLISNYPYRIEGYAGSGYQLVNIKGLPEASEYPVGTRCRISLEILEDGDDSYSYLTLEMIRQEEGWKVESYYLEK